MNLLTGLLLVALALHAGHAAAQLLGPGTRAAPTLPQIEVRADSVELSPSVLLVGKWDWEVMPSSSTGEPWSRCLDMVWRAAEAGSSRLNIVPTHHWLPELDADNGVSAFCVMDTVLPPGAPRDDSNATGALVCSPWSRALIAEFRDAMALCFAEALRQGMTLYVRPHLDDGTARGAWRNGLLMDPMERHGGFSYHDIMLAPLADAVRQALAVSAREETLKAPPGSSRPVVYFALQGEMSATIMRYASMWARLIPGLRQRLGAAGNISGAPTAPGSSNTSSSPPADIKIGVGLNFNRLSDTTSVSKSFTSSRLSWLMWQVGAEPAAGTAREGVPPIDEAGLRRLLAQELDFVGISAYAPYNLEPGGGLALSQFENSAFIFGQEMKGSYGIDVLPLLRSGKLELQYSEFGIGGGASYDGRQVALSPAEVGLRPFFGVYGRYAAATDPWSAVPANGAFRREFFLKAMEWLADPNNRTYKVNGVFLWSMNSWDVLGVYVESSSAEGGYRDEAVAAALATYNRAVRAAAAAAAAADGEDAQRQGGEEAAPGPGSSLRPGGAAVGSAELPVVAAG